MSHQIDPVILHKLAAFSQRRRKLIIFRGVCAAVATLLATMMLIAFIDWIFVLPDGVRWGLSVAAYLAVIVVEWRSCLRLLMHAPGPKRLARLVEHAEPKLREDLLSAVELGDARSDAAFDSEQFRALVQSDVASRMEGMDVERLLPANLVRRYTAIAAGIAVACVVAFALTGFQFGTLMMRALLPTANLGRVSKVQVRVVEPAPAEMRVPQGDTVPLVIEITGQRANKAMLETFTKTGGRELVQMNAIGKDRFSATIQVAREDVQYRVRAGDAITRKYQLESVARPAVVQFHKTYVYPEYTRLAVKRVTEENGDLTAIEGTEVELRLTTNQKVKDGELRVEQGKKSTVVPLTADGGQLVARVPLTASGIYRVRLVGAESGFENKFSPEYELRAEADLVPNVELELPKQDLILPANEIVDVQGTASDDLALAKVSQLIKINDGGWKEVPLAKDAGAKTKVERRWDLYEAGVKPGDLVTMKLLAVDLKGNRGESRPLQVTITASGFEAKRLSSLEAQRALFEALRAQQVAAEALAKRAGEARDQFDRLPDSDAGRKQALVTATAGMTEFEAKNAAVVAQLGATLREAVPGHQSGDLVLLARSVARANAGVAQNARRIFDTLAGNPAVPFARELMREAADAGARAEQRSRLALESYRVFLTAENIDVLNENVYVVAREQERLAELAKNSGDDAAKWAQLANRMRVVLTEIRGLEDLMGTSAEHAALNLPDRLRSMQKDINKQRIALEKAMAGKEPGAALLTPMLNLTKAMTEKAQSAMGLRSGLQWEPGKRYKELLADAEPTYANFAKLREESEVLVRNDKLTAEARAGLIDGRWEAKGAVLKAHGDAEETRPDSDSYFVNDVRTVSLALQGLHDKRATLSPEDMTKQLATLERDFRLLESGHDVAEVYEGFSHLATVEKWEIFNPKARTANPHDWMWTADRLNALQEALGKALTAAEIKPTLDKVREILGKAGNDPAFARTTQEMVERFKLERPPLTAAKDAQKLAAMVRQALDLLRKPMDEARKEIAQMAPTLAEMLAQLAKETEELKKETVAQAETANDKQRNEAKAEAKHALAEQQKLNEKVDVLKDVIRADANKQDVMNKDARERARDADDALAMLKEPPPRAAEDLQRAAQSEQPAAQQEALTQAADQQQKLANALNQLAQHYDNLEKGKADETRMALRATEDENGIKADLDAQFAKAEQLAQMAQQSPQEMLAQLEKALPQNPQMAKELSAISQNELKDAGEKLQQASTQENAVAQQVAQAANPNAPTTPQTAKQAAEKAAEAAKQAVAAAQQAKEAANNAVQAAKQANNQDAAGLAREARAQAEQAAQSAQQAAQNAEQAAQQSGQPQQMAESAKQAAQQAGEAAAQAQQAAQSAQKAQATAQQSAQQAGQPQAQNQESAKQSASAQQAAQQAAQAAQTAQAAAQQAAAMAQQPQMAQNAGQQPAQPNGQQPAGQQPAVNPQLAQAAQAQPQIAQAAGEAGSEISRAGRHEERLQNMAAGEQLQQLGSAVQQTAQQQVPAAQQALAQAQQAAQAAPAVNAANAELRNELTQLGAAQNPGQQAAQQNPQAGQQQSGQQAQSGQQSGQQPAGQQSGQQASPPSASQAAQPGGQPPGEQGAAPASPQEQVWMARTLDALDAALNAQAAQSGDPQASQNQQGQPGQQGQQPGQGQPPGQQPGQGQKAGQGQQPGQGEAQSAMAQAAQAAAAAMKAGRSETASEQPGGPMAQGGQQAMSKGGAQAQAGALAHSALAAARNKAGDWGKLPKQIAEQLTQGQREGVAGEYRNQIETYYRVIAEKSKKP